LLIMVSGLIAKRTMLQLNINNFGTVALLQGKEQRGLLWPRVAAPACSRGAAPSIAQGDRREPWDSISTRKQAAERRRAVPRTPALTYRHDAPLGLYVKETVTPGLPSVALGYRRRRSAAACRHFQTRPREDKLFFTATMSQSHDGLRLRYEALVACRLSLVTGRA